jgi:hypothetical protein
MAKEKKPLYAAVVLTDKSHKFLVDATEDIRPDDWKVVAHHMTIIFGSGLPEDLKQDEGKSVELTVKEIGASDKAIAVKVDGYKSKNKIAHITVAIPNGGSAVNSNKIKNWSKLSKTFKLTGTVQELYR